jgi:demethylmenaquinone methyltransferase/2-methoxy-6-polyprenyl-1,4-benzoquinol methylase
VETATPKVSVNTPPPGRAAADSRDGGSGMFNSIAPRYDLLNRLLSMRLDVGWRDRAIRALDPGPGDLLLDLCTGTGDFGLAALAGHDVRVLGLDVARDMMLLGRDKARRRGLEGRFGFGVADAEALPLADDSIDGALIAFGIRNVVDRGRALGELARALRPGGRLVILEFGVPPNAAFRGLYFFYFRHILPVIGGLLSGYTYLPESVRRFPPPDDFCALARSSGFRQVAWNRLSGGIVTLYRFVA